MWRTICCRHGLRVDTVSIGLSWRPETPVDPEGQGLQVWSHPPYAADTETPEINHPIWVTRILTSLTLLPHPGDCGGLCAQTNVV